MVRRKLGSSAMVNLMATETPRAGNQGKRLPLVSSEIGGQRARRRMLVEMGKQHRWGVILAGGEGTRLRSLTQLVSCEDKPKQFCCLLGAGSLFTLARKRIAESVLPHQTLFVLLKSHEHFYAKELEDVPAAQMIVQPANRGTLPAVLCSLLRIKRLDPRGVVALFPSDHYYSDESDFLAAVDLAFTAAEKEPESVILLGAPATRAETEGGWIEVKASISTRTRHGLLRVKRLWERPSRPVAEDLLDRGCVRNTAVMVGRAHAFLHLIERGARELYQALAATNGCKEEAMMEAAYPRLPAVDLSSWVLTAAPETLRVLCFGAAGWNDLDNPEHLIEAASSTGRENRWITLWRRDAARVATAESNSLGYSKIAS